MHVTTSSTDSIEMVASLYFVGIYTAKETYICVNCEKDRLVDCTIGTTGIFDR